VDWVKHILGIGDRDPYETSQWSQFFEQDVYHAQTACGYKVQYTLSCHFQKENHVEFKQAKMLDEKSRKAFLNVVHETVVLTALRIKGRSLRLLRSRPNFPCLCWLVNTTEESYIAADVACIELNKELKNTRFNHAGCTTLSIDVRFLAFPQTDEITEENYKHMIKLHDIDSIKNSPDYVAEEEAYMVAFAHREMELRKQFMHDQINQSHSGKLVTIQTKQIARAVEISWLLHTDLTHNQTLRLYRKQEEFWPGTFPIEKHGACIAESQCNDATIQTLASGTDYFFTMVIVEKDSKETRIWDTIKFSVRMPSIEEISKVDTLVAMTKNSKPRLTEKTQAALQELLSFVEFDENVSQLEKELVERISSKDYSEEEKEEKITRLNEVVDSLRIQNS